MKELRTVTRNLAASVAAAVLLPCCGARTELGMPDPCSEGAEPRPCRNACGDGVSLCEDGFYGACQVERVTRDCSTACGDGEAVCEDGKWQDCEVPEARRACENDCGQGEELCNDGAWSDCRVPRLAERCTSVCGEGERVCEDGVWVACDAPQPKPPKLKGTVRDFNASHPDFEIPLSGDQSEWGIVADELGSEDKPLYLGGRSITTSGAENFDQWYRDVEGVNLSAPLALELTTSPTDPALFIYDNRRFFPIDAQLFGNEGRSHNFHFTLEASTIFQYVGGEVFRFRGDDDMWVFINRRLAIDLGGIHGAKNAEVMLDLRAGELGLEQGEIYPLHFFFAERHTDQSNFTIETSIAEPGSCE